VTSNRGRVYRDRRVVLLTQHGKERVIASVLEPQTGCRVELTTGFDTDLLGTFTRDIQRTGTQLESARRKARVGMEFAGLPLGIASEGSFGPDPMVGFFPWNVEFLIWIDDVLGLEIVGVSEGRSNFSHDLTASWQEVDVFARQAGFPEHHLVVRPENENDPRFFKGITDWKELKKTFSSALKQSKNGKVFIETDMRAYANPTRMDNIRLAAEQLAGKLNSLCPACGLPGFWIIESLGGLACEACGEPTREVRAEVYGCLKCPHRTTRERTDRAHASAGHCNYCNP